MTLTIRLFLPKSLQMVKSNKFGLDFWQALHLKHSGFQTKVTEQHIENRKQICGKPMIARVLPKFRLVRSTRLWELVRTKSSSDKKPGEICSVFNNLVADCRILLKWLHITGSGEMVTIAALVKSVTADDVHLNLHLAQHSGPTFKSTAEIWSYATFKKWPRQWHCYQPSLNYRGKKSAILPRFFDHSRFRVAIISTRNNGSQFENKLVSADDCPTSPPNFIQFGPLNSEPWKTSLQENERRKFTTQPHIVRLC